MSSRYIPKIYKSDPDTLNVASGGIIAIASGGKITRAETLIIPGKAGHIGAGSGFVTAGNTSSINVPASETAATFVYPVPGLKVGDTITGYTVHGQLESAGNTVTIDADMRKGTSGTAANPTDASLGGITQVSKTADYLVAETKVLGTAEVIASTEAVAVLVTVTTAATTDVWITSIEVNITRA